MAQVLFQNFSGNSNPVTLTTTAETAIITSNPISMPTGCVAALILCYMSLSLSAGATSIRFRVRRGSGVTGIIVQDSGLVASGVVASTVFADGFNAVDTPPIEDLASYTLTATVAGASANSTTSMQNIAVFLF